MKRAIKKEQENDLKSVDADKLQLFLAKKGDNTWLESSTDDVKKLKKREKTALIESLAHEDNELQGESGLQKVLHGLPQPSTDQIHVLVVVPKQEVVHFDSQDGVFDRCSDQFFSHFPTVKEVGSWLEFPSLLPLTERQKLYVRASCKVIAEQALLKVDPGRRKYVVITGTPGIGKSVFVYYVMWKLIKDKKRVLFLTAEPPIYFDGRSMSICKQLPFAGNRHFWSADLWCLIDSVDPTTIRGFPILNCSTLLVSTPRRDCIGEFKKLAPTPDVFYMPLWTNEELATIAPLYPNAAAVWEYRFKCLGGGPRLVMQDIQVDPQALLNSACSSCSLDDCIMLVSIYSEINSKTKIIQTLIHIHSQEPYREYKVAYASELAMQVIARTKWRSDRSKMQSLLGSCDGNPLAQALCGYVFEPHAIDLSEEGGTFVYRKLLSGAEMRQLDTMKRKRGAPDTTTTAERVDVCQLANQLYVPRTSNYTAIDAWMPHFRGFQLTVGKKRDIKAGAADDLRKLGASGNKLYFLLQPLFYKSFTKKTPQTIEQFAILIPYPEEV